MELLVSSGLWIVHVDLAVNCSAMYSYFHKSIARKKTKSKRENSGSKSELQKKCVTRSHEKILGQWYVTIAYFHEVQFHRQLN